MKKEAIDIAKGRLRVMRKCFDDLCQCSDFDTFNDTWFTFLTAYKSVYVAISQGAISPQSRQWLGARKKQRRNDDLLQWVFEARNDEEHGLARSLNQNMPLASITLGYMESATIEFIGNGDFKITRPDGSNARFTVAPHEVEVSTINARGGRSLPPPKTCLNLTLPSPKALLIADLAIKYIDNLIEEASTFVSHCPED